MLQVLLRDGPNQLTPPKKKSVWKLLFKCLFGVWMDLECHVGRAYEMRL